MQSKGRPSSVVTEQRRKRAIALIDAGAMQVEVARELGITSASVCRSLKKLRAAMVIDTGRDFEAYRRGHLAILECIESSLLENKVEPEVAREWRKIRADIATFAGLNAPSKSISARVDMNVDPDTLVGYRRFVAETRGLNAEQIESVHLFARSLVRPTITATEPPEKSDFDEVV